VEKIKESIGQLASLLARSEEYVEKRIDSKGPK
jgi:hypothetical protein